MDAKKRLASLELEQAQATERWLKGLTDAELEALCADIDPAERAFLETLSDAEIESLVVGQA